MLMPMRWPLFEGLNPADVDRVLALGRVRRYRSGEILFHEGDPSDTVHLIASGRIAIKAGTIDGQTVTLAIRGAGDIVGELALLTPGVRRTATVVALEPVETLSITYDRFTAVRKAHPCVAEVLIRVLGAKLRQASEQLVEAFTVPAPQRVLRRLVELANVYSDGQDPATIPLNQQELAMIAGTTRATVNSVLGDEQTRGHLTRERGRIRIDDLDALRLRADR